jgi:hypothetical protein
LRILDDDRRSWHRAAGLVAQHRILPAGHSFRKAARDCSLPRSTTTDVNGVLSKRDQWLPAEGCQRMEMHRQ